MGQGGYIEVVWPTAHLRATDTSRQLLHCQVAVRIPAGKFRELVGPMPVERLTVRDWVRRQVEVPLQCESPPIEPGRCQRLSERDFGLPADVVKGGAPISGMFELAPVKLSWRNSYVALDDAAVARLSPIRHIPDRAIPLVIGYGTGELAEFQRQSREFAAAWRARGYPCTELAFENVKHFAVNYEFNKPQGKLLRAIFAQMNL